MKILVTGGTGFQGSHLVERLAARGHEVMVLNTLTPYSQENQRFLAGKAEIIWGSITDREVTEKAIRGKDVVFHLGARINVDESIDDPWGTIDVNVRGTYNVLEAVRSIGCRMIHTSTCEVYGKPERVPIPENAELRPHSPYAASKAAADRLCYAYVQTFKTQVVIPRFFNIFGERQKEGKYGAVIPIFVGQAMRGEPIRVFGTGEQTRDYVYISDIIDAYLLLLEHPELVGQTINFGTGVGTSIRDIAEHIAKRFNTNVSYVEARPGEASHMIADAAKAKSLLGWQPKVGVLDGIDRYIAWRTETGS